MKRRQDGSERAVSGASEPLGRAAVLTVEQPAAVNERASSPASGASVDLSQQKGSGIRLATLVASSDSGTAMLLLSEDDEISGVVPARSVVALRKEDVGRQVAILFENGEPERPIVLGLIQASGRREGAQVDSVPEEQPAESVLEIDAEQILLTARRDLVLRCGETSITLSRSGKVVIRGKQILSRASGVNRIKGGSVQIN